MDKGRIEITADCVALREGQEAPEILLVQRGRDPFKGLWSLPGGFVDENESLEQAARRELLEETGLRATHMVQIGAFGEVGRDPRGRVVSVAFLAVLDSDGNEARAADDAAEVRWVSVDELPELAFDHRSIIENTLRSLAIDRSPIRSVESDQRFERQ